MEIIDVTKPIEEGRRYYPTLPSPKIDLLRHYSLGHNHWTSFIQLPLHTATHIDAPAHFLPDGKTIDKVPVGEFISIAQVIDCSNEEVITKEILSKKSIKTATLLFKTRSYVENYTYFDVEAAKFIAESNVKIVGSEAPSVDRPGDKNYPVHKILLSHDILIVEGLNLKEVREGIYLFICLPLLIKDVEASPARGILIKI